MITINDRLLETALAGSFKNFHAKGLHYLCTFRSDQLTQKFYFFDGDVRKLPEVVNPHDHRYDFQTKVLAGSMIDYRYRPCAPSTGQRFTGYEWRTPLNGGAGFSEPFEMNLKRTTSKTLASSEVYFTPAEVIHTIRPGADQTVIMLLQMEDKLPLEEPTTTFVQGEGEAPSLDGLYERFTEGEIVELINRINALPTTQRFHSK